MRRKLKRWLYKRRVRRLAHATVKLAIRMYETGELKWIKGTSLMHVNGDRAHLDDTPVGLERANAACAIGAIAKAAWLVTGKPDREAWLEHAPAWRLKCDVEYAANSMLESALKRSGYAPNIPGYNDNHALQVEDVLQVAFRPARKLEPDATALAYAAEHAG